MSLMAVRQTCNEKFMAMNRYVFIAILILSIIIRSFQQKLWDRKGDVPIMPVLILINEIGNVPSNSEDNIMSRVIYAVKINFSFHL